MIEFTGDPSSSAPQFFDDMTMTCCRTCNAAGQAFLVHPSNSICRASRSLLRQEPILSWIKETAVLVKLEER